MVTPTLFLGEPPVAGGTPVETPVAALEVIHAGGVAVLPQDDYNGAEAVLGALGLDDETIEDRLHYARTGQPLRAV